MMKKDGFFTWEIFCLSRKAGALNARWEGTIWLAVMCVPSSSHEPYEYPMSYLLIVQTMTGTIKIH
jgi:hypothetical protein